MVVSNKLLKWDEDGGKGRDHAKNDEEKNDDKMNEEEEEEEQSLLSHWDLQITVHKRCFDLTLTNEKWF